MHTLGTRANAILYYAAMVLLVAVMANVVTSYFCFSYDVQVNLSLNKIEKLYVHYYRVYIFNLIILFIYFIFILF